jgi:hypothetical protein
VQRHTTFPGWFSKTDHNGELASTSKNKSDPLTTNNDSLKHPSDLSIAIEMGPNCLSLLDPLILAKDVAAQ